MTKTSDEPVPRAQGWDVFGVAVLLHMLLPFLPLAFERSITGAIAHSTVALTAALYPITLALASRSQALFAAGLIISVLFSFQFGRLSSSVAEFDGVGWISLLALAVLFGAHLCERYWRHVLYREPFFEWLKHSAANH